MTSEKSKFFQSPLAKTQVFFILIISLIISFFVSFLQVYLEYKSDLKRLDNKFMQIKNIQLEAVTDSFWKLDMDHLMIQLKSSLAFEDIIFVEIINSDYKIFVGDIPPKMKTKVMSFQMVYNYFGEDKYLGELKITGSLSNVYGRAYKRMAVILFNQMFQFFTLSFFVLLIIYRFVIKHLITISDFSRNISLKDLNSELKIKLFSKRIFGKNEIEYLVDSINHMRGRLKEELFEKNAAEKKLKESEETFRTTLNSISDGVITINLEKKIFSMNPVSEVLTGRSIDEALNRDIADVLFLYHIKTGVRLNLFCENEIYEFSNYNALLIGKNGSQFIISFSVAPLLDDFLNKKGMVIVFRDISSQFEKDRKILEKEKLYRMIFEQSAASIIVINPETFSFIDFNQKTLELFGYYEKELKEQGLFLLMNGEKLKSFQDYLKNLEANKSNLFEIELTAKSGMKLEFIVNSGVICFDNNDRILSVFNDVTEIRKMQIQIQEANKLESIGNLAGGIAHDFNNMVGGILGYADLLNEMEKDKEKKKYIKGIINSGEKVAVLTDKLLGFGKKGKNVTKSVDLNLLIYQVIKDIKSELELNLEIDIKFFLEKDLFYIDGDPAQLKMVIYNLCINGIEALHGKGDLILKTRNVFDDAASSDFFKNNSCKEAVEFVVEDTGEGIPEHIKYKIFEPFFSTRSYGDVGGRGLGLSSVYGIVDNHNGQINVYSKEGSGSVFELMFPKGKKSLTLDANLNCALNMNEKYILVIEDEELLRTMVEQILDNLGYKALCAANGKEGVEIFKLRKEEIACVILDMRMPVMNGKEAFIEMKKIDENVKVLLSTGYGNNEEAQEIMDLGAKALLSKPYHVQSLSEKLDEIIARKKI